MCKYLSSIVSFFRSAAFRWAATYGSTVPSTAAAPAIIPRPGGTVSPNAASASRENPRASPLATLSGALVYSTSPGGTTRPVALSINRPVTITPGGTSIAASIGLSPSVSSIISQRRRNASIPCLGLTWIW